MIFKDLGVIEPILKAIQAEGYEHPTPIQEQAIPILLSGKDLLACAQTGTGKTAAFSIPIIQSIYENHFDGHKGRRKIKALIVTPTRELAIQIGENITAYSRFTGIRNTVIYGGVKQGAQVSALKKGVDILIATPGRLLDLIGQGYINLSNVAYSVLDEADHMLDMGFIHDIKKIVAKLPEDRQSLFFSATMPPEIVNLSKRILGNPEKITIKPEQKTAERVSQQIYFVPKKQKIKLLIHLLETNVMDSVLVFSRTKHGANKIVRLLGRADIVAEAIHGNKSQNARQRALSNFKAGSTKVLVATDIAARGIDVDELSHVVNYDLPNIPETYVHRIGRTGRASASGEAISFCEIEERPYLRDIQRLIKQRIPVVSDHPFVDEGAEEEMANYSKPSKSHRNNSNKPKKNHRRKKNTTTKAANNRSEVSESTNTQTSSSPSKNKKPNWRRKKRRKRPHSNQNNQPKSRVDK